MDKKLQVFVSSTYTDLIEERQAAVQAILDAGHIPAGMELFKAGNQSQLNTIYKWIDESDVYMLILGGRYGSIEINSGLSYTELEYRYAIKKKIPVFAVLIKESWLTEKAAILGLSNTIEQIEPGKYQSFKKYVMSKVIRPVEDCKDIKIAVLTTLSEFQSTYKLSGWIKDTGNQELTKLLKNNTTLAAENLKLVKENEKLKINKNTTQSINGIPYPELINLMNSKYYDLPTTDGNINASFLDIFIAFFGKLCTGLISIKTANNKSLPEIDFVRKNICPLLLSLNIVDLNKVTGSAYQRYQINKAGSSFYAYLEINDYTTKCNIRLN
jgi:hypothetical protein